MQHAALHTQGQHIIWQQVIMKLKNTFPAVPKSKGKPRKDQMHGIQKSNQRSAKIIGASWQLGPVSGLPPAWPEPPLPPPQPEWPS
jgi:hypothetical protein